MTMRMQALRSALSTAQRQLAPATTTAASRAFSVATATATSPATAAAPVAMLSAQDWLQNIKSLADRNIPIKKTKLTSFLKTVTTSEELEASKEIMQIYERKRVDPDASAAGVFVKKALELDAAQLVLEVLKANYRIGLFLEPSTLNKLLSKFFKDGEFDKVYQLHDIGTLKYAVKSTDRTYDILIRTAIAQPDYDKALEICKTAAERKQLMRVTCNNLLFKLKENELADKIEEVASLMKVAGIEPNETTKKILQ